MIEMSDDGRFAAAPPPEISAPLHIVALTRHEPTTIERTAIDCGISLCVVTRSKNEALAALERKQPGLVLVDADLISPPLVAHIRARVASCVCALIDSDVGATAPVVLRLLRAGCDTVAVRNDSQLRKLFAQEGHGSSARSLACPTMLGGANAMNEVWRTLLVVSRCLTPVLVTGETGTGKELAARMIHRLSPRRARPFLVARGDAQMDDDTFERARHGTLYVRLDDLSATGQRDLLERLTTAANDDRFPRIVAASSGIAAGTSAIREDLRHRLEALSLALPSLRQRDDDVLTLWRHFMSAEGTRPAAEPTLEVARALVRYGWPGNVRELANVARHVAEHCDGHHVALHHLPAQIRGEPRPSTCEVAHLVGRTMKEVERALIEETYRVTGTVRATAEMLQISVRTVHYRLREYRSE